jgi:hypothetical protein
VFTGFYYGDEIKEDTMGGTCSTHGDMRNAYKILVGEPEVKWPVGRLRHRWEDNIRMDLREIVWQVVEWMLMAQYRTCGGFL